MAYWKAYLSWSVDENHKGFSGSVLGGFLFRAANHTEVNHRGNEALNDLLNNVLTSAPPGTQEHKQLGAWVFDNPLLPLLAWLSLSNPAKESWPNRKDLDDIARDFLEQLAWEDPGLQNEIETALEAQKLPNLDKVERIWQAITPTARDKVHAEMDRYNTTLLSSLRNHSVASNLSVIGAAIPWGEPAEDWSETLSQLVDAAVERIAHTLLTHSERHVVDVFVGVRPPPGVRRGSPIRKTFEKAVRDACVRAKHVAPGIPILYDLRKRDTTLVVIPERFDHTDHAGAFSLADLLAGAIRRPVVRDVGSWGNLRGVFGARQDGTWLAERIPLALSNQLPRPAVAAAGPARQAVSDAFESASNGALPPLLVGPGWAWDQASSWGEFARALGELPSALCAGPPQAQAAAAVVRAMLEPLVEGDLRHPTDSSSMTIPDRDRPAIVETVFAHVMNDAKRGQPIPYSGYEGFRKELKRRLAQTYFWHNEPRS